MATASGNRDRERGWASMIGVFGSLTRTPDPNLRLPATTPVQKKTHRANCIEMISRTVKHHFTKNANNATHSSLFVFNSIQIKKLKTQIWVKYNQFKFKTGCSEVRNFRFQPEGQFWLSFSDFEQYDLPTVQSKWSVKEIHRVIILFLLVGWILREWCDNQKYLCGKF